MKKLKEIKTKIEENIIYKVTRIVLYIFVALLLLVIIVQKLTNNNLSIGGVRVFMIISESMKDEYEIGDILISKKVPVEEINIGDNVTYLGEERQLKNLIITHKVVEKRQMGNDTYFVTRGLANNMSDPEIRYDQIYGIVVYKTIILSFIAKLMNNQLSYYILFTLVALIISIEIVSSLFDFDKEKEEDGSRK